MFLTEATVERMVGLEGDFISGNDDELVSYKSTLSRELSMIAVVVCMTCGEDSKSSRRGALLSCGRLIASLRVPFSHKLQ